MIALISASIPQLKRFSVISKVAAKVITRKTAAKEDSVPYWALLMRPENIWPVNFVKV